MTMTTHVSAMCRAAYYQLRQLRPLIRSLSFDAAKLLVQSFISTRQSNDYCIGSTTTCTNAYKPLKTPQHASSPTQEGASTSRPSCSSYTLASSPPTCSIQYRRADVQGTARPLTCVPGGRLPTCVCHWTPTTAFVGHRHVHASAANQLTFWRSLIRCCWTWSMEQSANPAARVRHYTRTISTSYSKRIYLVTDSCSAEGRCFRALCI